MTDFNLLTLSNSASARLDSIERLETAAATLEFPLVLEKREDSLIGNGHHESYHFHIPSQRVICFIWDEDHDERLFVAASKILKKITKSALPFILAFAERKACLTILVSKVGHNHPSIIGIRPTLNVCGDEWQVDPLVLGDSFTAFNTIRDSEENSIPYLENILDTRAALEKVHSCIRLRDQGVLERKVKSSRTKR